MQFYTAQTLTMHLSNNTLLHGGKYTIERKIGQGGFGITYKAFDEKLQRVVAIKEFFYANGCSRLGTTNSVIYLSEDKDFARKLKARFLSEARKQAQLNHPHIVQVYDVFEENETAYFVMEYVDGQSLADLLKSKGRLPLHLAVQYIEQLCIALAYLHEQRMCHLDIKPANILCSAAGKIKLLDFGLSKQYDWIGQNTSTVLALSKGYAPIEQYSSEGISELLPATDIYALGATLFHLFAGYRPPEATSLVSNPLPPIEGLSTELNQIIARAMHTDKNKRYQTVAFFLQAVKDCNVEAPDSKVEIADREEDATEIVLPNPAPASPKPSANLSPNFKKFGFGVLTAVGFILFGSLFYFNASDQLVSSLLHTPAKSYLLPVLHLGISIYIVYYCIAYEFVSPKGVKRNTFTLISVLLYYLVLLFAVWVVPNGEKLVVKAWFTAAAAPLPLVLYVVRHLLFHKLIPKIF